MNETRCAVYRLRDASGSLLYVGISDNPTQRFRAHQSTKAWWSDVVSTTLEWFPDRRSAALAEAAAIVEEHPLHNVRTAPDFFRVRRPGDPLRRVAGGGEIEVLVDAYLVVNKSTVADLRALLTEAIVGELSSQTEAARRIGIGRSAVHNDMVRAAAVRADPDRLAAARTLSEPIPTIS
jgi:predicted GIY-YIG superfamily endonuclease